MSIVENYVEERNLTGVDPQEFGVQSWEDAQRVIISSVRNRRVDPRYRELLQDYKEYTQQHGRQPREESPPPVAATPQPSKHDVIVEDFQGIG